ncbi:MAG TPA: phosphoribosylamine--glycine ligase [Candidatus Tumulicola sp.]|jgi:phosphoribosylamine--glycine ligase
MRVLVVGSGAREDALSWRLAGSPSCEAIFAAPGNAGTASRGENEPVSATDGPSLVELCRHRNIDLAVLGSEATIAAGVADRLSAAGISVFGPARSPGRLESSKIFSKKFMQRHRIPSARAAVVHSFDAAERALSEWNEAVVVKADGLAAGKGVVVTSGADEARALLREWYASGVPGGGAGVLLERRLHGREISIFALSDGETLLPFLGACDYKRAGDGDSGPNTGGMGAYSPADVLPADGMDVVRERILEPVLRGLRADGERYVGVLYCGLMWTPEGPSVIEFNVRFGDPETQVLMPRIDGDFAALLKSVADGATDLAAASVSERHCVGVVLATESYPYSSTPVDDLDPNVDLPDGCQAFWGASTLKDGRVRASGGRVLTVTGTGDNREQARVRAYDGVRALSTRFGNAKLTYRSDIAAANA